MKTIESPSLSLDEGLQGPTSRETLPYFNVEVTTTQEWAHAELQSQVTTLNEALTMNPEEAIRYISDDASAPALLMLSTQQVEQVCRSFQDVCTTRGQIGVNLPVSLAHNFNASAVREESLGGVSIFALDGTDFLRATIMRKLIGSSQANEALVHCSPYFFDILQDGRLLPKAQHTPGKVHLASGTHIGSGHKPMTSNELTIRPDESGTHGGHSLLVHFWGSSAEDALRSVKGSSFILPRGSVNIQTPVVVGEAEAQRNTSPTPILADITVHNLPPEFSEALALDVHHPRRDESFLANTTDAQSATEYGYSIHEGIVLIDDSDGIQHINEAVSRFIADGTISGGLLKGMGRFIADTLASDQTLPVEAIISSWVDSITNLLDSDLRDEGLTPETQVLVGKAKQLKEEFSYANDSAIWATLLRTVLEIEGHPPKWVEDSVIFYPFMEINKDPGAKAIFSERVNQLLTREDLQDTWFMPIAHTPLAFTQRDLNNKVPY